MTRKQKDWMLLCLKPRAQEMRVMAVRCDKAYRVPEGALYEPSKVLARAYADAAYVFEAAIDRINQ